MAVDYGSESPEILMEFLFYHEIVRGHSLKTVDEYFRDLRLLFRYLKHHWGIVPPDMQIDRISIKDIDLEFVQRIQLRELYDFLIYLDRDRGLAATSRARKVATIRSFFKFLTQKTHRLDRNPAEGLDSPKVKKALPKYLTLSESITLLESVSGKNRERDYCILTLFLNCALRISELIGLNLSDLHEDYIRVLGKGNKERIIFLNDACKEAIRAYLPIRGAQQPLDEKAVFISGQRKRISKSSVHLLVKKHLDAAGLDSSQYSAHKLRHTAATLMLQNGVNIRTLQVILGHEQLNTTQIYTHVDNERLRMAAAANPLANYSKSENRAKKPQNTPEK